MDCHSKIYIGIDPGANGFVCVRSSQGDINWVPLAQERNVVAILQECAKGDCIAVVEDVHALPGQGVASSFKFGYNVGITVGMLKCLGIPYHQVPPQKWQKALWERNDKVSVGTKTNPKKTSLNCAQRLFPSIDFRRTSRCNVADDNKVDATLICEYARLNF